MSPKNEVNMFIIVRNEETIDECNENKWRNERSDLLINYERSEILNLLKAHFKQLKLCFANEVRSERSERRECNECITSDELHDNGVAKHLCGNVV